MAARSRPALGQPQDRVRNAPERGQPCEGARRCGWRSAAVRPPPRWALARLQGGDASKVALNLELMRGRRGRGALDTDQRTFPTITRDSWGRGVWLLAVPLGRVLWALWFEEAASGGLRVRRPRHLPPAPGPPGRAHCSAPTHGRSRPSAERSARLPLGPCRHPAVTKRQALRHPGSGRGGGGGQTHSEPRGRRLVLGAPGGDGRAGPRLPLPPERGVGQGLGASEEASKRAGTQHSAHGCSGREVGPGRRGCRRRALSPSRPRALCWALAPRASGALPWTERTHRGQLPRLALPRGTPLLTPLPGPWAPWPEPASGEGPGRERSWCPCQTASPTRRGCRQPPRSLRRAECESHGARCPPEKRDPLV